MNRSRAGKAVTCMLWTAAVARAGIVFQDTFTTPGSKLNLGAWTTEIGNGSYLGRTQLQDWVTPGGIGQFVVAADGARLALSTFNPTGSSLYGTHGKTRMSFQPTATSTIEFTTRLQLTSLQQGIVYGSYFYGCPGSCVTNHDEIDIEILTNTLQPGSPLQVQLNWYANEGIGAGNGRLFPLPAGFDPLAPHNWTIRWSRTRIEFLLDDVRLGLVTDHIPQGPMQATVDAWGPDTDWSAAYSSSLQKVSSAAAKQTFVARLTSVTVSDSATPVPVFAAAPLSLQFAYRKGDSAAPAAKNISVTSTPTGVAFTSTVTTAAGGNWLSVTPASGTSTAAATVSTNLAVLAALSPGTYTGKVTFSGTGAAALDAPVSLTVVSANAPLIAEGGVVPVYSASNTIQQGSWISIYGSKLADATTVWNGDFPTTLANVSVTINNKPGYLWFVSPGQLNLQAPDDTSTGLVNVTVTNPNGSFTSSVTLAAASPSFSLLDSKHAATLVFNPDGTYDIVGPTGAFPFPTRPVKADEVIVLYGVGFGPTTPAVPGGKPVTTAAPTASVVTLTIGGVNATVTYSALVLAGLYQINAKVPAGLLSGDQPIRASVAGVQTETGPVITLR
jgi:uncharacterized protein (TIGR03437 family)